MSTPPLEPPATDRPAVRGTTVAGKVGSAFVMFRNPKSVAGLVILGFFLVVAVLAPWIAPYPATKINATARFQPPSTEHWLGTTHLGEDVFSQIIWGTRGVMVVGILATVIAITIAITVGVVSGYTSGWRSESLSALANVFLVIPGIPLIIVVSSLFEDPPLYVIATILGLTGWAWGARVLRAQTMSLRNRDFVQAAKANGEPLRRIIAVEMLPNLMGLIAASIVGTMTAAVIGLTTLSFIGVIPVSNYNWGTILNWASAQGAFQQNQWWWYLPPGLCIAAIGVALSLLNFGIDEYVNPRLRSAGERARALKKRGLDVNQTVTQVRRDPAPTAPAEIGSLVAALSLADKVRLLTGRTPWRLHDLPDIGLRGMVMSDGPVGVRGTGERPGETSVLFPSPTTLAAAWDDDLAVELGRAFAAEARAHGVDVVLAPQVNIQRTPVGGRHFECYSEDPLLTARIGAGVVRGLQSEGVAACVKHYIANDAETDRTSVVSRLDRRTLREVYLAPFEAAVAAGAWSIMAAYNQVDVGTGAQTMTAHRELVVGLLKDELGFDGVVVSDWEATRTTVPTALGGLDLVMPGPLGPWRDRLLAAVASGEVPEDVVDDKVARLLLLARRVGALDLPPVPLAYDGDLRELARRVATRGTVVLKAEDPVWDRPAPATIALIGANAVTPHVLGGGSCTVVPEHVVSPAEGLAARFHAAELTVLRGGDSRRHPPALDADRIVDGVRLTFLDAAGDVLGTQHRPAFDGSLGALPEDVDAVEIALRVALAEPGRHRLEVGTVGGHAVTIDGRLAGTSTQRCGVEVVLDSSINVPPGVGLDVEVTEPRTVEIVARHLVVRAEGYGNLVRAALRHRLPGPSVEDEIAEAVEAARTADLAVVVVGTNEEVESEGWDRTGLGLPGRQDELVERVLAANPRAVVVVNAGSPVLLPWLERAGTVLWTWFPGQEAGHALAAVLAGDVEATGRLPWTLPAAAADVPVPDALPVAGVVTYTDGVDVGYRGWERSGAEPAAPFGHGLGWTTWSYDEVAKPSWTTAGDLVVAVHVTNTGDRPGRETVQVYLEPPAGDPDRPVRWLAGYATVEVAPGAGARVEVTLERRRFEVWDEGAGAWHRPAGPMTVRVGRSVRDLRLAVPVPTGPGR